MFLAAPLLLALCAAAAAAPDLTQLEFQAEVSQRDTFGDQGLKFTFPKFAANGAAGTVRNMDISSNPILATLPNGGLAQNVDVFAPCTLNVAHAHPRGNEIYFVQEGSLEAGIQEETGGQFNSFNLSSGQNVVVPQGLLHYTYNPSCSNTSLVQFFDNADSGTVIAYANIVNNFRDEVLTALTGLDADQIGMLKAAVPKPTAPITQSSPACRARCGLPPASPSPSTPPNPSPSPSPYASSSSSPASESSSSYASSPSGSASTSTTASTSSSGRRLA